MMHHPAELALNQYMVDAANGKTTISDETIEKVASGVAEAVKRQFGAGNDRSNFTLRMSNIGRPTCQLWFDKNKPEAAEPLPNNFVMNMLIGDIVEEVFKGLLTEAGVDWLPPKKVSINVEGEKISGTYDIVIDGKVDDVKSASNWSYNHKFDSFDTLRDSDPFGYVSQLVGYSDGSKYEAGGWWVVNKANGEFKYVPATGIDKEDVRLKIADTVRRVKNNEFVREFDAVDETFNGKPTGNKILCKECMFCRYKYTCWPTLEERPAVKSKAKSPPIVGYVEIKGEYTND